MRNMLIAILVAFVAAAGAAGCDWLNGEGDSPSSPTTRNDGGGGGGGGGGSQFRDTDGCISLRWGRQTRTGCHGERQNGFDHEFTWYNSCDFRVHVRWFSNAAGQSRSDAQANARRGSALHGGNGTIVRPNSESSRYTVYCPGTNGRGSAYITYCTHDGTARQERECITW